MSWLKSQTPSEMDRVLKTLDERFNLKPHMLPYIWEWNARPSQFEPDDYFVWFINAGRGWGKTRTATETVSSWVRGTSPLTAPPGAPEVMSIIADSPQDMRQFTIEGPSGFLNVGHPDYRPVHKPSVRTLEWPNGCKAVLYSAEDPEALRGASGSRFWWDELAKAKYAQEGWDNLMFGLREYDPKGIITTTPKPIDLIVELVESPDTFVTVGSSFENEENLDPRFVEKVLKPRMNTRLGRQEIYAEILKDLPGALWSYETISNATIDEVPPLDFFKRIVVSIDPSGTQGQTQAQKRRFSNKETSNDVGIVVAGLSMDDKGYILADKTCNVSPGEWGAIAVRLYEDYKADLILAERNFGGAMVKHVIRTADPKANFKEVTASRGKVARAEPVAALYEQGRMRHVPGLKKLEDQMTKMTPEGFQGSGSPDRVDAMVWAITELMLKRESIDEEDYLLPRAV